MPKHRVSSKGRLKRRAAARSSKPFGTPGCWVEGFGGAAGSTWALPRRVRLRTSRSQGEVLPAANGTYAPRMRDIETIDSELRLVATLRRAARERGGPLLSVDVADALRGMNAGAGRPSTDETAPHHLNQCPGAVTALCSGPKATRARH